MYILKLWSAYIFALIVGHTSHSSANCGLALYRKNAATTTDTQDTKPSFQSKRKCALIMYAEHIEQCGERTAVPFLENFCNLTIDDGTLFLTDHDF